MSNRALSWAFRLPITGAAKAVLLALADHLNDTTGRLDPSHATLSLFAGVDERTVRRACTKLEDMGLIEVIERPGRPSAYRLFIAAGTPDRSGGGEAEDGTEAQPPRTPCPTPSHPTPGTTPDHPGHHARPTPDTVSDTPDTTPDEPLEPLIQPLTNPYRGANADRPDCAVLFSDEEPARVRSRRRKPEIPLPADFGPDQAGIAFAASKGVDDIQAELASFSNWHLAKGNVFRDWQAAWRTWCGNVPKFQRAGGGRSAQGQSAGRLGHLADDLQRADADDGGLTIDGELA